MGGCPQGRTTVYVDTTKTTVKPTTNPYTLAPTDYRIFVNLQNKKGLQVSLNPTQSAITASKLVPIFQELLKLPTAIKYDAATNGGKMFFFRAGGLEIRFPKTLEDQYRPDAKVVRALVRKMNEDALADRRRRGVNGAKIAYLDVTFASGQSKKDLVFIAGASDYYYDAADTSNQPTAPVPTKPVVVVTTRPLVAKKTVPTITRTRTTKMTTTAKWMRQETKTYMTTTETVTSTTYTGTTIAPTTTTKTIDRSNADSIDSFLNSKAEGVDQSATVAPYVAPKVKTSATTIVIIIVIVLVMVGVGVLVICRMKQKLDVTASDPNYVWVEVPPLATLPTRPPAAQLTKLTRGTWTSKRQLVVPRRRRVASCDKNRCAKPSVLSAQCINDSNASKKMCGSIFALLSFSLCLFDVGLDFSLEAKTSCCFVYGI